MTIPKRIIEKAIQGGWRMNNSDDSDYEIALSASFWEALGKALGWETTYKTVGGEMRTIGEKDYKEHAHRFLDAHFAGTTDAFWSEIIPDEK